MKKIINLFTILVFVALLGGAFYWLEWRPSQIRIECANNMHKATASELGSDKINGTFDEMLKLCLYKKGISK